ncbi:hypothetical protein XH87_00070 [Bradyrhizobium sp. CCBAU 53415]|nr:hypothetical protein [Bradyrhizobium sp. CCBAU 53415]
MKKGAVFFAHPDDIRKAIDYALENPPPAMSQNDSFTTEGANLLQGRTTIFLRQSAARVVDTLFDQYLQRIVARQL